MAEGFRELMARCRHARASREEAAAKHGVTPAPHPDGLLAAKIARSLGLCLFCEEPLPPANGNRKQRIVCERADCRRAYWRAWSRDGRTRRGVTA